MPDSHPSVGRNVAASRQRRPSFKRTGDQVLDGNFDLLARIIGELQLATGTGGDPVSSGGAPIVVDSGVVSFDQTTDLNNNARVAVRKNTGADVGKRRRLNLIEGSNITLTVTDDGAAEEVDVTIAAAGASVAVSTVAIPFTDGDTARRVTVTDASVTTSSKIIGQIRRPDGADADDHGYVYHHAVVRRQAGSFDLLVVVVDWGGEPVQNHAPNETVNFDYVLG